MAEVEVQGVRYPVPESFTYQELSLIKKLAGSAPDGGYSKSDPDVLIAVVVIAMTRAGQKPDVAKLYALDADEIQDVKDPEAEDGPPPVAVEGPQPIVPPTLTAIQPDTRAASGGQ